MSLRFGASLDPANIAEGNDVYFECGIDANPDEYKIVWIHDVSAICCLQNQQYDSSHICMCILKLHFF